jgi:Zn-finger nucleic acid-binding protein
MNCPVCQKLMVEQDFGGVKVDICANGCKGIWFDWFELTKLDETNEGVGRALGEALRHPRVGDEARGEINCPKCGKRMQMHQYQKSNQVNVDECYICGGFFLDSGELKTLRDTHMTEQEEQEYLDDLLADIPGYQQRKQDLERQDVRRDAARRYARFMRLASRLTGE